MAYWKRKNKTTKILIRRKKPVLKRKVGHRNLTDKSARKLGRTRKKGYVNTTDGAKRKSHKRSNSKKGSCLTNYVFYGDPDN